MTTDISDAAPSLHSIKTKFHLADLSETCLRIGQIHLK